MNLRNMIISGALVLAAQSLTGCAGPNTNTATPARMNPSIQTSYKPVTTSRAAPMYPHVAQYQGVEGDVKLCFVVKANGSVGDVQSSKTKFWTASGRTPTIYAEKILKEMAFTTIKKWKFTPRRISGKPVTTPGVCQTIEFRIGSPPSTGY